MTSLPINDNNFEQFIDGLSQLPAYTIGRNLDNAIVIINGKISGHHARLIHCTPTSFIFEDLSSKNGSFVNGMRITRKVVDKQDTLRLADTDFSISQLLALLKVKPVELVAASQLTQLLPLNLTSDIIADVALVVDKDKQRNMYRARTVLSMDMAYIDARLITRPDREWLNP